MSKLYVDESKINLNVIPEIDNAIQFLNQSIEEVGTLNIPQDFEYAQYLKNIFDNNLNSKNKLLEQKHILLEHFSKYNHVVNENKKNIEKIPNVLITLRKKDNKE